MNAYTEPEQTCSKCQEEWPLTTEFFFHDSRKENGFMERCKACYYEYPSAIKRRQKQAEKTANLKRIRTSRLNNQTISTCY